MYWEVAVERAPVGKTTLNIDVSKGGRYQHLANEKGVADSIEMSYQSSRLRLKMHLNHNDMTSQPGSWSRAFETQHINTGSLRARFTLVLDTCINIWTEAILGYL